MKICEFLDKIDPRYNEIMILTGFFNIREKWAKIAENSE